MKINWFTVIAQIVNFLVLVWLLKRFLYKPILKGIADREKLIASQLKDAELKKAEANKERDDFQKKNLDFEQQLAAKMNMAIEEVKTERQKLLEEARTESNLLRSNLGKALRDDEQNMSQEIARKTQEEVFAIARKTLVDLSSLSLEEQTINIFISRVAGLRDEQRKEFIAAFGTQALPFLIRSAFELPPVQRSEIEKAVKEVIATKVGFQYETSPELVSGIEMNANGYKLSWNISDYLDSLKHSIVGDLGKEKGEKENVTQKPE
jgi:F-type H+-transporting ATPase subunit b